MRWLQRNLSGRGFDGLILLIAAFLAGNITLLVAWLLWGG